MIIVYDNNLGHEGLGHMNWGHEGRAYYASEIKRKLKKKLQKGINGFQMRLLDDLIRLKCHSDHFLTFWKTFFFEQKVDHRRP